MNWDIRREGRAWGEEGLERFMALPEKKELVNRKLFDTDEQRLYMLGCLLENVGADQAVRLGDPKVWREAIEQLERERARE